jgi:hypothetical protein
MLRMTKMKRVMMPKMVKTKRKTSKVCQASLYTTKARHQDSHSTTHKACLPAVLLRILDITVDRMIRALCHLALTMACRLRVCMGKAVLTIP